LGGSRSSISTRGLEVGVDELTSRYVAPFYLQMMGLNALNYWQEEVEAMRTLAPALTVEDLTRLLRSEWRPRVMGAWFALFRPPSVVGPELLRSLETSGGGLTAPPLATVATHMLGDAALPSLMRYAATEEASRDGSGLFVAAAIEALGAAPAGPPARDEDRVAFATMLSIAGQLPRK
jgi:hypothetical protein